ncbi:hypothetical protein DRP77_09950 [Candidatus Poribacteria bacterium]|nr:MAG: hypothetical protein DRP77_09950 [Candidatus Poribacteria bacterium]
MRAVLIGVMLLSIMIPHARGELTKEDVIQIIRTELEPIKLAIAEMRGQMATKDDLLALQRDMIKRMDEMRAELLGQIGELRKANEKTNDRIDSLYHALAFMAVTIFVAILSSIVAGTIFAGWWRRRQEEKSELRRIRERARMAMKDHPEFAEAYQEAGLL